MFKADELKNKKILIIGDIILDRYLIGDVNRISREAPIQVIHANKVEEVLGGAANVANNILKLGGEPYLIGAIGNDNYGEKISKILIKLNVSNYLMKTTKKTTVKTRIISKNQQLLRVDEEEWVDINKIFEDEILNTIKEKIEEGIECVILSDYGQGLCTYNICRKTIDMCNEKGILTIVDPRGDKWNKYSGATIIKPNLDEFFCMVGSNVSNKSEEIINYGKKLLDKYKLENILVTRAEKGMILISENKEILKIECREKKVYDVSGAGDTVIATMSMFLANGFKLEESIYIANIAAEISVGKRGTYAVNLDEINSRIKEDIVDLKIGREIFKNIDDMNKYIEIIKKENKKMVFTNGCFDIVHLGHIEYLKKARNLGDILIVGLNSDESVRCLKGKERPINNENDRAKYLLEFDFIDAVIIFNELTPKNILKKIRPNVLVKGGDYKIEDIPGREYAEDTVIMPYKEEYSTTKIINKIKFKNQV